MSTGRPEASIKPADRIMFLLEKRKWSKKKLSEESGISYGAVLNTLKTNHFKDWQLTRLASCLRCSVDWLLGLHPDQLKAVTICDKPLCGMAAAWVVVREGMPLSEGLKCCDEHDNYYFSRDRTSRVYPFKTWVREMATSSVVEITKD